MNSDTEIALPDSAPLMVLPECVLFPGIMLPLRIFEPRYRTMLDWALTHDRLFCMATMKPGVTEAESTNDFHHVAGIGLIRASVQQPDGTSNLLLQGITRVRFTGFIQSAPFRIADIEAIPSVVSDEDECEALIAELRTLCVQFFATHSEDTKEFKKTLSKIEDPGLFADFAASSFLRNSEQKQLLLEEPDATERLRSLRAALRSELGSA